MSSRSVVSTLIRPDGAKIYYQVVGDGPITVLLLARGGMRSSASMWSGASWDPLASLSPDRQYRLIAMDQRMSTDGDLPDGHDIGWTTFRDDQIALLDHLNVERCHLLGSCIGPSYALQLLRDYPQRFGRAVLMQPIGLGRHTTEKDPWVGKNAGAERDHWFGDWAAEMKRDGRASQEALDRLHRNMFGPSVYDFVFTVTRQELSENIRHPLLVFSGVDFFHPAEIAREVAHLAQNATLIEEWRDAGPEKLAEADAAIKAFLSSED